MTSVRDRAHLDPLAVAVPVVSVAMALGYVWLMRQQGDRPAAGYLAALATGAALGGYGAVRAVPLRRVALALAGVILVPAGVLGLLSIGIPIIVAGVLALAAAVRPARRTPV